MDPNLEQKRLDRVVQIHTKLVFQARVDASYLVKPYKLIVDSHFIRWKCKLFPKVLLLVSQNPGVELLLPLLLYYLNNFTYEPEIDSGI